MPTILDLLFAEMVTITVSICHVAWQLPEHMHIYMIGCYVNDVWFCKHTANYCMHEVMS